MVLRTNEPLKAVTNTATPETVNGIPFHDYHQREMERCRRDVATLVRTVTLGRYCKGKLLHEFRRHWHLAKAHGNDYAADRIEAIARITLDDSKLYLANVSHRDEIPR